ncbi:MAG TPA: AAA family ATPase [Candidatus Acidoferrales bacterium]|nr:AAA family ATPase [Candidatus Acidoferrales bacterium]
MQVRKRVIAISGMPGAGKGVASEAGQQSGLEVLLLGDVIREETQRRGLEPTPKNVGGVMLQVRRDEGPAAVVKRLVPKIEASQSSTIIVEGVRSEDELRELRTKFDVISIAIHASPKTRFQRLLSRGRSDDPKTWDTFYERDSRELNVGLGHVIALADVLLVNESTIETLQSSFKSTLDKLRQQ